MPGVLELQFTEAQVNRRLRYSMPSLPGMKPDRLRTAKTLVEEAVKLRKVFSVQGPYPVIRVALWSRGWVERRLPPPVQRTPYCPVDTQNNRDDSDDWAVTDRMDEGEKEKTFDDMYNFMSRLVQKETTHFYWTSRPGYLNCHTLDNDQITNHFAKSGAFTTKVGLCLNLRNLRWFDAADPDTFFPRCYLLGAEDEKQAFKDLNHGHPQFVAPGMIDFAVKVCEDFLGVLEHSDIDATVEATPSVAEEQWDEFMQDYYRIVQWGALIRGSSIFVEHCQAILIRLQEVCPQLDTDGLSNIWIIKPGAKSRGRGIMCMNRLEEILALVNNDRVPMENKWVVQKYLERPLLVHGTKFDLRQWFLVTDWNPLTAWFYRECYLRFSTQPYSTTCLDSSVHLCNNSIQKHFQPSCDRHPGVPEDNMWSCSQFKAFLLQQGFGAEWESVVVPGMQKAVIRALQTAQDLVEPRKASFELYGADFMLGRDLRPWLLEINTSPTMACSTAVTARLCPAVQLDTLRVVLDRRTDPSADTGGFQLIYKQAAVEVPRYVGVNLLVEGAPIRQSRPPLHGQIVSSKTTLNTQSSSDQSSQSIKTACKTSSQRSSKISALLQLDNENQAAGEQTRQTSASFMRGVKTRDKTSYVRRFSPTSKQPLLVHIEPRRKTRQISLNLGTKGTSLAPQSLSFSLSPPQTMSVFRSQPIPGQRVHITKSLSYSASGPFWGGFPPLRGTLPTLEVLSLRPNVISRSASCKGAVPERYKH